MRNRVGLVVAAVLAVAVVACGDSPATFGAGGATSVAVGVGGTGGTGAGGDAEGGSGGQGGAATGQGGHGGAGGVGGGGGEGGQGGGSGLCPAPSCGGPKDWNCDPACGALSTNCPYALCRADSAIPTLGVGSTKLRFAPLSEQIPKCKSACQAPEPWLIVRAQASVLPGDHCLAIVGPEAAMVRVVVDIPEAPDQPLCAVAGDHDAGCSKVDVPAGMRAQILLAVNGPTDMNWPHGGSVFYVDYQPGKCDGSTCSGAGCNGDQVKP